MLPRFKHSQIGLKGKYVILIVNCIYKTTKITSHRITSHHITSYSIVSYRIESCRSVPYHIVSYRIVTHDRNISFKSNTELSDELSDIIIIS